MGLAIVPDLLFFFLTLKDSQWAKDVAELVQYLPQRVQGPEFNPDTGACF